MKAIHLKHAFCLGMTSSNQPGGSLRGLVSALLPLLACSWTAEALAPTEIELGFQSMYNLQFDQAHQDFSTWERLHPDDPLGPVSQAAGYLFAEFARLDILESQLFTNDKDV